MFAPRQEYLERHSVHKMAGSPRSPQATPDESWYQSVSSNASKMMQESNIWIYCNLVGALEHVFPYNYWEFHHPN